MSAESEKRMAEIQERLDEWRRNAATAGGDQDIVAIFEAHAADDVYWLLGEVIELEGELGIERAAHQHTLHMERICGRILMTINQIVKVPRSSNLLDEIRRLVAAQTVST